MPPGDFSCVAGVRNAHDDSEYRDVWHPGPLKNWKLFAARSHVVGSPDHGIKKQRGKE